MPSLDGATTNGTTTGSSISYAEMKAIADRVYKTPYSETNEGKLDYPDYKGLKAAAEPGCPDPLELAIEASVVEQKLRPTGIADTALDFVGNTPLIRMDRLREALGVPEGVELLAKAECYSAGRRRAEILGGEVGVYWGEGWWNGGRTMRDC